MVNKFWLLIGAGVGYVLGARAGRERYDQIADQANKLWTDPRVQDKVEEVKAKAPVVAEDLKAKGAELADQAKSKVTGHETTSLDGTYENETGQVTEDGVLEVDATGFGPGGEKLP
ncbi:YtxH domain-containing protein [Ornithinimicrobium sp. Y1847]|uniref:YtxH domain-containing protein n=1 Tax=unclassified Ornithinimicrobium TaxID=2615080 RepID=UPI003B66D550